MTMTFTWIDFVIVGLVAISFIISLVRGFIKEVLSLVVWVLAFFLAHHFSSHLLVPLSNYIQTPSLQVFTAFAVIFLVVLLMGAFVNYFLVRVIHSTGLTSMDRMLGGIFGIARGVVIVTAMIWLGRMTPMVKDPWWQQSTIIPHFQLIIDKIHEQLPLQKSLPKNLKLNRSSQESR